MAALDARLVASLGLSKAAAEFVEGRRRAGLTVPARFGTEVAARLLGLRINHPTAQDCLELLPPDPATRAEAAYSAARILGFGWLGNSWQTAAVQSLADSFTLPHYSRWQRRILDVAVSKIGMPYIWGGTSDGREAPFGVRSRGGYDCSGFVWRVYKLQSYPGEGTLASTLQGRTTFLMSVEVPASERIPFARLQPADVVFFGEHGPRSTSAEVDHMGIYVGNGWFIQSSDAASRSHDDRLVPARVRLGAPSPAGGRTRRLSPAPTPASTITPRVIPDPETGHKIDLPAVRSLWRNECGTRRPGSCSWFSRPQRWRASSPITAGRSSSTAGNARSSHRIRGRSGGKVT